jgi:succinate dehydrogenase / fumarate reductase membrane anchor subunit
MKFETVTHAARGLGTAKDGVHHWIAQRFTALALIPLGLWFVVVFMGLLTASYEEAREWLSSPWVVSFAIAFIFFIFYHGYLGICVIVEDYITHLLTKWLILILTKIFSLLMVVLGIVSLLKIFLT